MRGAALADAVAAPQALLGHRDTGAPMTRWLAGLMVDCSARRRRGMLSVSSSFSLNAAARACTLTTSWRRNDLEYLQRGLIVPFQPRFSERDRYSIDAFQAEHRKCTLWLSAAARRFVNEAARKLRYSEPENMQDLKGKMIRGGLTRVCAQGANLLLRVGSLMILARLLSPKDFGLVGMVMAFTGALTWFRDFGLSSAAIQHPNITKEQISTLFWINMLLGALLGLVALAMAPAIAAFYGRPELFGVTLVLAAGFLFNAAGVQHSVLLQRQMRFTALAVISIVSSTVSIAIAIAGAEAGYGYWALVAMSVTSPLIATLGFWLSTGWIPKMPRRRAGIRAMIHFGG